MTNLLTNLQSPAQVAAAIEANTLAYWASHSAAPGAEMRREADRVWIRSGRPCPITNCVLWADFPPDDADRRIEETLALYRPAGLPGLWAVGPSSRPADLGRRLLAHGLRAAGAEPGMAVELARLPEPSPPAGLVIEPVDDPRTLELWVDTYICGFGMPVRWYEDLLPWETDPGDADRGRRLHYLGRLGGWLAATAQLVLGGGVAGLYGLATVPEARRLGIGTAMARYALRQALDMGYRVGVLFAAAMGRPLYHRLGFREFMVASDYSWNP